MALQNTQPTIDWLNLGVLGAKTLYGLLKVCVEEDVQPITLFPLKSFGSWIAVSQEQLVKGREALAGSRAPLIRLIKVTIGLSIKGIAAIVAQDIHLTAAFSFANACSSCLSVEQTGKLMHEMMILRRSTGYDSISSLTVSNFIRTIIGYGDFIQEETVSDFYCRITRLIHDNQTDRRRLPGLTQKSTEGNLAKLLHDVFDALENMDYTHITLEGCQSGLFIATLLLWLRKGDVELSVYGTRIYPEEGPTRRLSINLVDPRDIGFGEWKFYKWQKQSQPESIIKMQMNEAPYPNQSYHHYPLSSARYQLSCSVGPEALDVAGHLAAALVDLAFERGVLHQERRQWPRPLQEICSDYFAESYHTIMKRFGWDRINQERQNNIAKVLGSRLDNDRPYLPVNENEEHMFDTAYFMRIISDIQGNQAVKPSPLFLERDHEIEVVVECAIHLAAQALRFCFYSKAPLRALYVPLTTANITENAHLLRCLISSFRSSRERGCHFWSLRAQAIRAILPGVISIDASDLAIAWNGYVVFSSVVAAMDSNMTDPRKAAGLQVVPGILKCNGETGTLDRLSNKRVAPGIHTIKSNLFSPEEVGLFSPAGAFCGIDENKALNNRMKIEHWISIDQETSRGNIINLDTRLVWKDKNESNKDFNSTTGNMTPFESTQDNDLEQNRSRYEASVPANWERSIETIVFALHVWTHDLARPQEEVLARRWRQQGYLEKGIKWVGIHLPKEGALGCITRTRYDEPLRFFGVSTIRYSEIYVFVRQRDVPLIQCMKEAMTICGGSQKWLIIA